MPCRSLLSSEKGFGDFRLCCKSSVYCGLLKRDLGISDVYCGLLKRDLGISDAYCLLEKDLGISDVYCGLLKKDLGISDVYCGLLKKDLGISDVYCGLLKKDLGISDYVLQFSDCYGEREPADPTTCFMGCSLLYDSSRYSVYFALRFSTPCTNRQTDCL